MRDNSFKIEPGRTISHFRLEKMLGEGGMGAVYLAEDLTLSRRVAIKFMRRQMLAALPNPAQREKIEQRFIREAKSAACINHANIAQIYEADFETDHWYIAMEFIDGQALDEALTDKGPFKPDRALEVIEQTALGLEYAWDSYKIIHRDIKPQNLMTNKRGHIKIVDLGLAKPIIENSEEELELTGAGVPIGTPYYMAPEQASGGDVNQQTDIFALGATVYELLSGKKCFQGKTPPMIYNKQINKDYLPLTDFGVAQNISDLIDKMLEPNQDVRYKDYEVLLFDVKALRQQADNDNSITLMQTVDASMVNQAPKGNSKSLYGTVITGDLAGTLSDDMQTMVDVFYPVDFKILDRYRILKVIGRGNSGVVYHCMDTQLERECSVKSIKSGREYRTLDFPRIKKNYISLSAKKHENLVEILDIQESENGEELLIIMELLRGRNLLQYTNSLSHLNENIEIESVAPILLQIAKALDSVSTEYHIVHNDLKPVSIFISDEKKIKLLDYGVTYLHTKDDANINNPDIWKYPISNPDYMSPEIWAHQKPNMASDQYSLAVIIYEVISHKLPFWIKDMHSTLDGNVDSMIGLLEKQYKRVTDTAAQPIDFLDKKQNKSLLRALSKNPQQRFPTCESFINGLSGTQKKESRNLLMPMAAALLIGAAAFGGYMYVQNAKASKSDEVSQNCTAVMKQLQGHVELEEFQTQLDNAAALQAAKKFEAAKVSYKKILVNLKSQYDEKHKSILQALENTKADFDNKKGKINSMISASDPALKQQRDELTWPEFSAENTISQLKESKEKATSALVKASNILAAAQSKLDKTKTNLQKTITTLKEDWQKIIGDDPSNKDNKIKFEKHLSAAEAHLISNDLAKVNEQSDKAKSIFKTVTSAINSMYKKRFEGAEPILAKLKVDTKPILFFLEGAENEYSEILSRDTNWQRAKIDKRYKIASLNINNQIEALKALKKQLETTAKTNFIRNIRKEQLECEKLSSSLESLKEIIPQYETIAIDSKQSAEYLKTMKFKEADEAYKNLKARLSKMSAALDEELKKRVNKLNTTVTEMADRLEKAHEINNQIGFEIDEFQINNSLARAKKAERKYRAAYEEYNKLIITGTELEKKIKLLSTPIAGKDWAIPKLGIKFVWVAKMKMWVGQYEITNGEYRKFKPSFKNAFFAKNVNINGDRQPVAMVSYSDAQAFCKWLTKKAIASGSLPKNHVYRLPSRSEWINLATAGNPTYKYPFGNTWPPKLNPKGSPNFGNKDVQPKKAPDWKDYADPFQLTATVNKSGENAWHIFGTSGNVWEWSSDSEGEKQAIFGGSWSTYVKDSLITEPPQLYLPKASAFDNIGFRVILAPLATN